MASFFLNFSQEDKESYSVIDSFDDYSHFPREVAYAHLNKSTYIKGEVIAFSAYIFDKNKKNLSKSTTNLYCTLTDEKGKNVKSKLLLVNNGVAQGDFLIDSLITSGTYTFKAYTNWMKNFKEPNFFIEQIKVIDPELKRTSFSNVTSNLIDAQFLPEGGHLLANCENYIGIVIKDSLGFGLPYAEGKLFNSKNILINRFSVNQFGIGKLKFIPMAGETYHVKIEFNEKSQVFNLETPNLIGIAFSLHDLDEKVVIRLLTNEYSFNSIINRPFKLTIHNGSQLKSYNICFKDSFEIKRLIYYDDLFSGVNIITVFDDNNIPIVERLFFNFKGINFIETGQITLKKGKDSTEVSIPLKDVDNKHVNKFSISVLPEETIANNQHNNIISYNYLSPYLNGHIENPQYYFNQISRKKKYEMDNLLITQGWSSYDWEEIFNYDPTIHYRNEKGIDFIGNIASQKIGQYIFYPISNSSGLEIFNYNDSVQAIKKYGLFPYEGEIIKISGIRKNGYAIKPDISARFLPFEIPELNENTNIFPFKENVSFEFDNFSFFFENSLTTSQQLNEVIINVNKENVRLKKLKNSTILGHVDVFDEIKRNSHVDFATYLRTKGFNVIKNGGKLDIYSNRGAYRVKARIYVDDVRLFNFDEDFRLDIIDYVIIDKSGFGEGIDGMGGVIKIYTDPNISFMKNSSKTIYQEIEIPLTFSSPNKFYTPKYRSYNSRFFKQFGVVAWFNNLSVDQNGNINFKISNKVGSRIKLYIEGAANEGSFISEIKSF